MSAMFHQLTILGPGLLGGSLGMAAHRLGLAERIIVWSRRAESRVACEEQPWCAGTEATPEAAAAGADLIVLCTPVDHIVPLAEAIADAVQPDCLITDVGSTKSLITRHATAAFRKNGAFVGAHPMAGSDKTGLAHARSDLFRNRPCFVTPLPDSPADAVERTIRFWDALDMEVTTTSPERHDEMVAHISHLPHLLASLLCAHLAGRGDHWEAVAGQGLADTTRIAGGDPHLWRAIFDTNREEVLRSLDEFQQTVDRFQTALRNRRPLEIVQLLEEGRAFRKRLDPKLPEEAAP
ncbi:MAG: prephenate dehydrogenase [Opitutales bacterium]